MNNRLTNRERELLKKSIHPGGCVVMKSGGPVMTVRSIEADNVEVEWFEKERLRTHVFKQHSLFGSDPERLPVLMIDFEALGRNVDSH